MTIYIVTGTRHPSPVLRKIAQQWTDSLVPGEDEEVDGEAIGIDTACGEGAEANGVTRHKYGIERVFGRNAWARYGKGIGHRRNERMVDDFPDGKVVGFWNGSSTGTRGCLEYAARKQQLYRVYFENGMIWSWPQGDGYLAEDAWDWTLYGMFMANDMYQPSRITLAHSRILRSIENTFQCDEKKLRQWMDVAEEGRNMLLRGVFPWREKGAMIFDSRSGKGSGHRVYARSCNCKAAEFKNPCWARAAGELLDMLEVPPEHTRLDWS